MAKEAEEEEPEQKHCPKCGWKWHGNPYAPEECPICKKQREGAQRNQEKQTKKDWRDIKAGVKPGHQRSLEEFQGDKKSV